MRLSGIELHNFRSIGSEPVILNPLGKCNVLVGQNNSGKSNILRAVKKLADKHGISPSGDVSLPELDRFRRSEKTPFSYKLWFEADQKQDEELAQLSQTTTFWFEIEWQDGHSPKVTDNVFARITDFAQSNKLLTYLASKHWSRLVTPEEIRQEFQRDGDDIFRRFSPQIPRVSVIPEFRRIVEGERYSYDGAGLIKLLTQYHMPAIGRDLDQRRFERLQEYMRRLLHLPRAQLEITYDDPTFIIKNEDIRLPLGSFGTGVHELLIILTAVTSIENSICCIEEPEIHLHPRLQRELVELLIAETSNQYLLTTHSSALINLDNSNIQVFHVRSENGSTVGQPVQKNSESLRAIRDLGIKASDLLQTNCIIWVEGPSDRVYLQRWIELVSPDLVEGRDYVFMFYRQLPNLNIDAEQVDGELINVLQMNRNTIIVIDSDKNGQADTMESSKQRMSDACEAVGGLCWITEGREIENHLSSEAVSDTIKSLRGCDVQITVGPYDEFDSTVANAVKQAGAKPIVYSKGKLDYSRKFAERCTKENMTELVLQHMQEFVSRIKQWNL